MSVVAKWKSPVSALIRHEPPIRDLGMSFDVSSAMAEIEAHPELWNQHTLRIDRYQTPHKSVSDIWVRYNDFANFEKDAHAFTQLPHDSVWYPCIENLPAVKNLVIDVFRHVVGEELGGVLITKIPPGGRVEPHIDTGWHAGYYDKFAVQIKGNKDQAFCFEGIELRPLTGDLYTFDNSQTHWVINDSDEERMTLIVCIRR